MHILKLLSEEVFDFSRGEMTQAKIKDLKNSLNSEFKLIHELCLFVLNASQKPDLIRATLGTLYAFLSWVPLGYVFESNLVEILLKLFPQPLFRNLALQCLTEVSSTSAFWAYLILIQLMLMPLHLPLLCMYAHELCKATSLGGHYPVGLHRLCIHPELLHRRCSARCHTTSTC